MFLGISNTVFLNISNYLPHIELRNPSTETVNIMNSAVISNVGIKRFDCINNKLQVFFTVKSTCLFYILPHLYL